ncbi:hypothetical protein RCL1_000277 [Eukaryota sp. TZLM3-RCL]
MSSIHVFLNHITENAKHLKSVCDTSNISIVGVTKGFCADLRIAEAILNAGINSLGDSRLQNLVKLRNAFGASVELMMLRLPMISQASELVHVCDVSLNSEISTIEALNNAAIEQNKRHKVVLMVDLGDRREGIEVNSVIEVCRQVLTFSNIKLIGLGVNLSCLSGVLPDSNNLGTLSLLADQVRKELGVDLPIVSGGGTSSFSLISRGEMPSGVTQLRLGESILLGFDSAFNLPIPGLRQDTFVLRVPCSRVLVSEQEDDKNMVVGAVTSLDVRFSGLTPVLKGVMIVDPDAQSLMCKVPKDWEGDCLDFSIDYVAMLSSFTSDFVDKNYHLN